MSSITIDELVVIINAQTSDFKRQVAQINDQLDGVSKQTGSMSKMSAAAFGVIAGAAQALVSKGINLITSSVGDAAKRIDTLNNSQKVFQNLGFSAKETKTEMNFLDQSIRGLPTTLNDAVSGVEALASVSGNLKDSTQTYKALNDGILAMGGSADMVRGSILQLSQLPMDGPLDAQTWNSLRQNGLTPVMVAMAKDMGLSISQMKADFGSGKLTVQDFTDELQKLDKKGGGGMASLEKQAHDATNGITTGWANMQTAITRGVADIMVAIGSSNISGAISSLGKAMETALKNISSLITFVEAHKTLFGTIATAMVGATAAFVAYNTAIKLSAIYMASYAAASVYLTLVASLQAQGLGLLRAAWLALDIVMTANPIGVIIVAIAALVAGLIYFFTQTEIGRQIFAVAMEAIKIAAVVSVNFIIGAFSAITGFFQGLWTGVKNIFNAFITFVKNEWFIILLAVMTGGFALIVGLVFRNWDSIVASTRGTVNAIIGFFRSLPGTLASIFISAKNTVFAIWSGIPGWFGGIVRSIGNVFSSIPGTIRSWFNRAVSSIKSINWSGIGMDIIKGIGNGISSMGSWLADQAKNAVGSAKDQLKSFLGIHSPSRVMRDEVGKMMGLGVAEGIDMSTADAVKSATLSAKSVLGAFNGVVMPSLPTNIGGNIKPLAKMAQTSSIGGTPVNVQVDGQTLLSFVIDGINNKAFMSNSTIIDY